MVVISLVQQVKDKTLTNRAAIRTQGTQTASLRIRSRQQMWHRTGRGSSEPFASPPSNVSEPFVAVRFRSSLDSRGLTLEQVQSGLHAASRCSQHLYCSSCTQREAAAARAVARVTRTTRGIHAGAAEDRSCVQLSSAFNNDNLAFTIIIPVSTRQ